MQHDHHQIWTGTSGPATDPDATPDRPGGRTGRIALAGLLGLVALAAGGIFLLRPAGPGAGTAQAQVESTTITTTGGSAAAEDAPDERDRLAGGAGRPGEGTEAPDDDAGDDPPGTDGGSTGVGDGGGGSGSGAAPSGPGGLTGGSAPTTTTTVPATTTTAPATTTTGSPGSFQTVSFVLPPSYITIGPNPSFTFGG